MRKHFNFFCKLAIWMFSTLKDRYDLYNTSSSGSEEVDKVTAKAQLDR
jgi:hypothetical protein